METKKTLIEVIKANKMQILKKGLIIGAGIVGMAIISAMSKSDDEDASDVGMIDMDEVTVLEEPDEVEA